MITETRPAFANEATAEQWAAMIVVNREPAAEALGRWLGDPDSGEAFTSEYMGWWTGLPAEDKFRASHIAQTPDTILRSRIEQAATDAFEQFAQENLITWDSLWPTAL